jgi:cytochrome c oxidase subunit II
MNPVGTLALLETQASTVAQQIDLASLAVTLNAVFFSVAIALVILYLVVKYRRGSKVDRSNAPAHNNAVEITWTVVPLIIALALFAWVTVIYFHMIRVPPNAMEIQVVGKQWMWKMQHPSGRWENNRLHVPVGRPVVLTMTSEDVIHAFYVPAFRLKQDVIPGQFTQMWFQATTPGTYHLFCAEFCGTLHSTMVGEVIVMEPAEYERWLREGDAGTSSAVEGARLFRRHGCSGCHGANSSVRAPLLEGIYGKPVAVQLPKPGVKLEQIQATTRIADLRYIHDSIVLPEKEVAAGFKPIMPTFKNRLTEEEILKIVAYIRSISTRDEPGAGREDYTDRADPGRRQDHTNDLSEEDYRARTGFVPTNMDRIRRGGAGVTGGGGGAAGGGAAAPRSGGANQGAPSAPAGSGAGSGTGAGGGGTTAPGGASPGAATGGSGAHGTSNQ